jgi:hypothetical protein
MPAPSRNPRALAERVAWGERVPELTAEIEACDCTPEVRAGLWLLNGELERAHRTVQSLDGPIAAHWHALVHRHEPDLANSKYWQRRVGESPVYPALLEAAGSEGMEADVAPGGKWDALRFTDLYGQRGHDSWTRRVDRVEMQTLLAHCLKG